MAERRVFVFLDLVRGIAAIAVVLRHSSFYFPKLLPASHLAVDLFFILSGFVIAFAYQNRLIERLTWIEFTKVRWIRLYPVFLLGALLGAVWFVGQDIRDDGMVAKKSMAAILLSFFMLPSPFSYNLYPTNGPSWSLFFEILVNLLYAAIAKWLTIRVLILVVIFSAAFLVIAAVYRQNTDIGFRWVHFYGGVARVCFGFFSGVLVYRAYALGFRAPQLPAFLIIFAVIAIFGYSSLYCDLAKIFLLPLVVWFGASVHVVTPHFTKVSTFCGLISYPIYMIHVPVIRSSSELLKHFVPNVSEVEKIVVGTIIVIAVVAVSYVVARYIDVPVRGMLTKIFRSKLADPAFSKKAH